ncbi:uncharacterized protein [Hoplias malabaricus]|uniref:uncharacterized protein n=1 Tax=Hoplias malabaricus TaxID=27720 RepID=UPI003463551C
MKSALRCLYKTNQSKKPQSNNSSRNCNQLHFHRGHDPWHSLSLRSDQSFCPDEPPPAIHHQPYLTHWTLFLCHPQWRCGCCSVGGDTLAPGRGVRRVKGGVNGTADPLPGPQPCSQGFVRKLRPPPALGPRRTAVRNPGQYKTLPIHISPGVLLSSRASRPQWPPIQTAQCITQQGRAKGQQPTTPPHLYPTASNEAQTVCTAFGMAR